MWLGKLTVLDMTPLGWLGRKTSTQTNKIIFDMKNKYLYVSVGLQGYTGVNNDVTI